MTAEAAQDSPRIAPLEEPFAPEIAEELARWMPRGAPIPPLALFRTLGKNLPLSRAMWGLGSHLLGRGLGLTLRERELMILRVCARLRCEYEWGVHATAYGAAAGLAEEEIDATARRELGESWSEADRLLLALADELHEGARVTDDLWAALAARYDEARLLALLALAGWYRTISVFCLAPRVAPEPWARRFPG